MLRLTGILTGSALAIAALLLVIGIPRFTGPAQPAVTEVSHEVTKPALQDSVANPHATEAHVDEPVSILQSAPTTESSQPADSDSTPTPPRVSDSALASEPFGEAVKTDAAESKWFAFWSPFRSQIAADGFVSELQRTTGLDYRVVKLKPGVYEVAFEYSDDRDRQDKLSRIAAATGLDLSDG